MPSFPAQTPVSDENSQDTARLVRDKYTFPAKQLRLAGDLRKAIALLLEGLQEFPDNSRILCSLGAAYKGERKYDEARGAFRRAIKVDPLNHVPRISLGHMELDLGNNGVAAELFLGTLSDPQSQKGLSFILRKYIKEGNYKEAESLLETILAEPRIGPRSLVSQTFRTYLAKIKYASGEIKEAYDLLQGVLEANPQNIFVRSKLGEIKFEQGDLDGAEKLAREALQIRPRDKYCNNLMGNICLKRRRFKEAREWFLDTMGTDKLNLIARAGLVRAEIGMGNLAEARRLFALHFRDKSYMNNSRIVNLLMEIEAAEKV